MATRAPLEGGQLISKFARMVMRHGKLATAEKIINTAVLKIKAKDMCPTNTFQMAVTNAAPIIEVRSMKRGGTSYQVPFPIQPHRQSSLAMKMLVVSARGRGEKGMGEKLAAELIDAAQNTGKTINKRDEMHKIAQVNRAYAAYRW